MSTLLKKGCLVLFSLLLTLPIAAQENNFNSSDYEKYLYDIEMRDGIKLNTVVYAPKDDASEFPILIKRTPYNYRPYGKNDVPEQIIDNPLMQREGFIIVCQDVRGRWMSEGQYTTMTPNQTGDSKIDESSDT